MTKCEWCVNRNAANSGPWFSEEHQMVVWLCRACARIASSELWVKV